MTPERKDISKDFKNVSRSDTVNTMCVSTKSRNREEEKTKEKEGVFNFKKGRFCFPIKVDWLCILKVVGNEQGGGSGGWLLFEDGFGQWRSMSVYCSMLP